MAQRYDLVIVGLGSAGLTAASFAAKLPWKVAAVEGGRIGGDCLWTGCVPSKALLAAGKVAHHMRTAGDFGIEPVEPEIDTAKVLARVRTVQDRIAATDDSPEHVRDELGIDLFEGRARLVGPHEIEVSDGTRLWAKHVLLCTGSRPAVPPIPGLEEAGYLTSESVWEIERAPASMIALGGGPIAIETAQGFRRLGVRTAVVERAARVLPREEPELVDRLVAVLLDEGVDVRMGTEAVRVRVEDGQKVVETQLGEELRAEELVVSVGRTPNVEGLGLDELGIAVGPKGVETDGDLRTSVPSVWVAGDLAGRFLFTHSAAYEAVRAVRNMAYPGRSKGEYAVPWCTFTDPELAHAGLTSAEARERFGPEDVEVHRHPLTASDRGRAENAEEGLVVVVTHRGKIVGAHLLAPGAGELIHELALAMHQGMKLSDVGQMIHVYPTIGTEVGRLGGLAAMDAAAKLRFLVRSAV